MSHPEQLWRQREGERIESASSMTRGMYVDGPMTLVYMDSKARISVCVYLHVCWGLR